MKLTIREIADIAGVSAITVSQILNNKGSRFNGKIRDKVLTIVAENHCRPDYFVSNVINRHSKTTGMVVPDVTDFFFSKVIEGAKICLNSLGYTILLCNPKHDSERAMQYINELIHRSADDIISATPNVLPKNHILKDRRKHPTPVVPVNRGINSRDSGQLIVKEYKSTH